MYKRKATGEKVIRKKKKVVANPRVPRTRNNQTMTEAQFFSWIRNNFRRMSMYWKPIAECRKQNRRRKEGVKKLVYEYQCHQCKKWHLSDNIEVDHIHEAGSLRSFMDLSAFAERLFCEVEGLVCLCKPCHAIKTHKKSP